jgi:hypothetical protein
MSAPSTRRPLPPPPRVVDVVAQYPNVVEEEQDLEVQIELFSGDSSSASPLPMSSPARQAPQRAVPIPPGKTEEDFSFLIKVKQTASPSELIKTVKAKNQLRMSVLIPKPIIEHAVSVPIIIPPLISFPNGVPQLPSDDSLLSPRGFSSPLLSPRVTPGGKKSKSDRVKDVLARIAQQEHAWVAFDGPAAVRQRIIDDFVVSDRGDWVIVDALSSTELLWLAHALLCSFPRDVLLTPAFRDLFVDAAKEENDTSRKLSFHSLYFSLPANHVELLSSVLKALKGKKTNCTDKCI